MDCPRCSSINLDEWTVCADCGAPLHGGAAAAARAPYAKPAPQPVTPVADIRESSLPTWGLVCALLLAPVGLVLSWIAYQRAELGSVGQRRARAGILLALTFIGLGCFRLAIARP